MMGLWYLLFDPLGQAWMYPPDDLLDASMRLLKLVLSLSDYEKPLRPDPFWVRRER